MKCLRCGSTWGPQTRTPLCEATKRKKRNEPQPRALEGLTQVGQRQRGWGGEVTKQAEVRRDAEPLHCDLIIWVSGLNV